MSRDVGIETNNVFAGKFWARGWGDHLRGGRATYGNLVQAESGVHE